MASRRKRREGRGTSDRARAGVEAALREQEEVARRQEAALEDLLRKALRSMISDRVLEAVEAGSSQEAQNLLSLPGSAPALALIKRVQRDGYKRGRDAGEEAGAAARAETFAELSDERRAVLAAREARKREFKATPQELKHAREQAKQMMRSFRAAAKEELARIVAEGKRAEGGLRDARSILAQIRAGRPVSPEAKRFLKNADLRVREVTATPLLEADWSARTSGMLSGIQVGAKERVVLVEFGVVHDNETTPACQFLSGGILPSGDPRTWKWNPMLHYGCRSMWVATSGTPDEVDWDEVVTKYVGEPKAGAPGRSYSISRSQIRVPGGAPSIPPPESLSEWIG